MHCASISAISTAVTLPSRNWRNPRSRPQMSRSSISRMSSGRRRKAGDRVYRHSALRHAIDPAHDRAIDPALRRPATPRCSRSTPLPRPPWPPHSPPCSPWCVWSAWYAITFLTAVLEPSLCDIRHHIISLSHSLSGRTRRRSRRSTALAGKQSRSRRRIQRPWGTRPAHFRRCPVQFCGRPAQFCGRPRGRSEWRRSRRHSGSSCGGEGAARGPGSARALRGGQGWGRWQEQECKVKVDLRKR